MSYDVKFREAALGFWRDGHSIRETAKVFSVDTRTLQHWKNRLKAEGTIEPKKRKATWRKISPERLEEYVKQHPDAFLKEIAEVFGCSDVAILYALKRLKYTRKKTTVYKEANESYQQDFIEKVSKLPENSIIYVDETGINKYLYREFARAKRGVLILEKISGKI